MGTGLLRNLLVCTGCRNRTYAKGFGDLRTTIILIPLALFVSLQDMRHTSTVSLGSGLNRRPHPYHGCALPTELPRHNDTPHHHAHLRDGDVKIVIYIHCGPGRI